jgi:hypothetical protein
MLFYYVITHVEDKEVKNSIHTIFPIYLNIKGGTAINNEQLLKYDV